MSNFNSIKPQGLRYEKAERLMETAKDRTKGKPMANNTRLHHTATTGVRHVDAALTDNNLDGYEVKLHGNVIMIIYRHYFEISDGGWQTVTTKERLNRYLPRGMRVYQKNFEWYFEHDGHVYDFDDVLKIEWVETVAKHRRIMLRSSLGNSWHEKGDEMK